MKFIRYTLLTEGTSDRALMPLINWAIAKHFPDRGIQSEFACDLGNVGSELRKKIPAAIRLFPCDVLFVHRDTDNFTYEDRLNEIMVALHGAHEACVPVIPIRMTEAWLLSDESAIRAAAGNKNGTVALNLPSKRNWESVSDPKKALLDALEQATEKSGRALKKFNATRQRARVAELTSDFSRLRGVSAFDSFESLLIDTLTGLFANAVD